MRQSWIRNVTMVAVLATAGVVLAGTVSICGSCTLPGVDSCGNLCWDNSGCLKFTGTYNCKCGTLVCCGKGNVTNCSCKNQTYKCSGLGQCVLTCLGYQGTTCVETYCVTKKGCATFTGGYKCVTPAPVST